MRTATSLPRTSSTPSSARALPVAVRAAGGVLLLAMAWIHWDLWRGGFRDIAWIGPLFLANAVLGTLAAVAVVCAPLRWLPWAALLGGLLEVGTLGGLLLSLTVGLFGYRESVGGYVVPSILVEAAGFVVLAGYGGRELLRSRRRGVRRSASRAR